MSYKNKPTRISSTFNPSNFVSDNDLVTIGNLHTTIENNITDANQTELINQIVSSANTLHEQVNTNTTYQSTVDSLGGRVTTLETVPDVNLNYIDVDLAQLNLNKTTTNTNVATNSSNIALKSNQTSLDATNINVSTNSTNIALKSNQTSLDTTNANVTSLENVTQYMSLNGTQLEFAEDIKMEKDFKSNGKGQIGEASNRLMFGQELFSSNKGIELYYDSVNDKSIIKSKKLGIKHNLEINDIDIDVLNNKVTALENVPAFDNTSNSDDLTILQTGQSLQLTMINNNISDISTNAYNIGLKANSSSLTTTNNNISTNSTNIATNSSNIATNTTDITNLTTSIPTQITTAVDGILGVGISGTHDTLVEIETLLNNNDGLISTLNTSTSSNLALINTNITNIGLKANTTSVNSVINDVTTNATNIATNVTNISNKLDSSYVGAVTSLEHSYLDGVTSSIQTQINGLGSYDDSPVIANTADIATNTTNIALKLNTPVGGKISYGFGSVANVANGLAVGYYAKSNGSFNVILGAGACKGGSGGGNNSVIIGGDSCYYATPTNSVFIGHNSGGSASSSTNNIAIGEGAGTSSSPLNIVNSTSNRIVLGNNSTTNAYIACAWSITSDIFDKVDISSCDCLGLEFINNIDVIKYKKNDRSRYVETFNNKELGVMETTQFINDGSRKDPDYTLGISAQQIQTLENQMNPYFSNMIVSDDDPNKLSLKYQNLIMPLINAVKELTEMNKLLMDRVTLLETI